MIQEQKLKERQKEDELNEDNRNNQNNQNNKNNQNNQNNQNNPEEIVDVPMTIALYILIYAGFHYLTGYIFVGLSKIYNVTNMISMNAVNVLFLSVILGAIGISIFLYLLLLVLDGFNRLGDDDDL